MMNFECGDGLGLSHSVGGAVPLSLVVGLVRLAAGGHSVLHASRFLGNMLLRGDPERIANVY